jgi:hypothetical protein
MTMADHKCEVCEVNEPIGVASTVMPYSCAYCVECARRFAQPKAVFEYFFAAHGTNFEEMCEWEVKLETFHEGKYIKYREWAEWRKEQANEDNDITS